MKDAKNANVTRTKLGLENVNDAIALVVLIVVYVVYYNAPERSNDRLCNSFGKSITWFYRLSVFVPVIRAFVCPYER